MDRQDLSYWAGYLDGDGCISLSAHTYRPHVYVLRLRATSACEASCRMLAAAFGGSVRAQRHTYRKKDGTLSRIFAWDLGNAKAEEAIRLLAPYLRVRREHAALALAYRAKVGRRGDPIAYDLALERQRLAAEMQRLNARGTAAPLVRTGASPAAIAPEELAYLAGLFDAEGTVCWINDRRRANPLLHVGVEATADLIPWQFALRFGGEVNELASRGNPRGIFKWARRQAQALPVLTALLPYLREKRQAAEAALTTGIRPATRVKLRAVEPKTA